MTAIVTEAEVQPEPAIGSVCRWCPATPTSVPALFEDLRPYCPKDLLDEFDDYAGELQKRTEAAAAAKGRVSFGGKEMGEDWGVRLDNLQTPGHFNMHARLHDLDGDGVAAEVMFHDSQNGEPIPFQTDTLLMRSANITQDFDLLRTGQRIYNQWLADACSIEPERHIGLMHLPMWDIDAAIEELQWAHSVGLKGINFPTPKIFLEAVQLAGLGPVLLRL